MKHQRTSQFTEESSKYRLCYCCEECVAYNGTLKLCAYGWPNSKHLRENNQGSDHPWVTFCKSFELR